MSYGQRSDSATPNSPCSSSETGMIMLGDKRMFSCLNQRDLDYITPVRALSFQAIHECRGQIAGQSLLSHPVQSGTAHILDLLPPTRDQGH